MKLPQARKEASGPAFLHSREGTESRRHPSNLANLVKAYKTVGCI